MAIIEITNSEQFKTDVLSSTTPVLVDFWAEWCGPCKILGPIVEEIASDMDGQLNVAKVNVDEQPDLAGQYGILSIPTMKLFKNGQISTEIVGLTSKQNILSEISKYV
jgi:thioredoxin 1